MNFVNAKMRFNVHLPNLCINTMNGYIETFNTDPPLYGMLYSYIGYDADIYPDRRR